MPDKAIFLDRDDTIIEDPGYINSAEQVKLVPAAAQALVELRKLGFKLIVVSNQSGIARGIIPENAVAQIHDRLKQLLAEHNAYLDRIYYCPFHPDGALPKFRKDSDWRKPKPGMLLAASKELKISLTNSWMIGNGYNDIAAGKAAGCRTILIKSNIKPPEKKPGDPDPDFEVINMREAVNVVKREITRKPAPPQPLQQPIQQPEIQQPQPPAPVPAPKPQQVSPPQTIIDDILQEPDDETQTQQPQLAQTPVASNRTEHLLEEIKLLLKSHQRNEQFSEFSAMKLIAGVLQVLVLFCLVVAVWYKLSPTGKDNAVLTAIGFAITFQLITLTLYIMHKDK
ncbi:MAG: HAD family hydrolase [Sedimentisphaerales bacterium]|jgi:D-glycero-D-manno-heptose 1,7-bisphosphate phosphatase